MKSTATALNPQPGICDLSAALARLGGDIALLKQLAQFFREDSPELLTRLQAAVAAGDPHAVQRVAHALRGLAANFDAQAVFQASLRLEQMGEAGDLAAAAGAVAELEQEIARLLAALSLEIGKL